LVYYSIFRDLCKTPTKAIISHCMSSKTIRPMLSHRFLLESIPRFRFPRMYRASIMSNGILAPSRSAARIPEVNPSSWKPYNVHAPTNETFSELISGKRFCAATVYYQHRCISENMDLCSELWVAVFPCAVREIISRWEEWIQGDEDRSMLFFRNML